MTRKQLDRFISIRNKSLFNSNLQFQIDADQAGIKIKELGQPARSMLGGYEWHTPHGLLVELPGGQLMLR